MWQDSDLGKYIEFKIRVSYNEGNGSAHKSSVVSPTAGEHTSGSSHSTPSGHTWEIYKRYSSFIDLQDKLMPYYKAESVMPPVLPPKIMNKKNAHRNEALTQRKNQLQAYLR